MLKTAPRDNPALDRPTCRALLTSELPLSSVSQENLGETEVRDALLAKAEYLASIGDKDAAVAAFTQTEEKTAGGGNKLDLIFSQIR